MGPIDERLAAKYLQNYAEAEARCPILSEIESVDAVLVIPAYRESPQFLQSLLEQSFSGIRKLLLILVSNHPDNLSAERLETAIDCHKTLVAQLPNTCWTQGQLHYYEAGKANVLLVDKTEKNALDAKQGVGLARKIGADIALSLFAKQKISSPWIFNTDADAHLPDNYFFAASGAKENLAAIIYPYRHIGLPGALKDVTRLYEAKLDHYVKGLKFAGSPYAFQTVGSCLAISPDSYIQVRGFPKRAAGEDFYLLNKLAKIGAVDSLSTPKIELDSRSSDRIPFGTGPAVSSLLASTNPWGEKIFYHPSIFRHLKLFLESLAFDNRLAELPEKIQFAAKSLGIDSFLTHAETQKLSGDQYCHHFHLWFDGFKTLKFIHFLRNNYHGNISYEDLKNLELSE